MTIDINSKKVVSSPQVMQRSFLASMPDFRLLVRSTADNNHETTLVVPKLPVVSLRYARLLVAEGSLFLEHAVALVQHDSPSTRGIITRALSAARPTRVTFLTGSEHAAGFRVFGVVRPSAAQVAAAAVTWAQVRAELRPISESDGELAVVVEDANGLVRLHLRDRFFEVEVRCADDSLFGVSGGSRL